MVILATVTAGGSGAVLRYVSSAAVDRRWGRGGTQVVNILGSLLAGLLAAAVAGVGAAQIVAVGGLGGFTTFSTWMLDVLAHEQLMARMRYAVVSLLAGVAAAVVGFWLGIIAA